jgi:hypothetical protein
MFGSEREETNRQTDRHTKGLKSLYKCQLYQQTYRQKLSYFLIIVKKQRNKQTDKHFSTHANANVA